MTLIGHSTMLNPEELEIQSLYLNMLDNPEVGKILYDMMAEGLDTIITEMVNNGALELKAEDIINALIEYRDGFKQISAL